MKNFGRTRRDFFDGRGLVDSAPALSLDDAYAIALALALAQIYIDNKVKQKAQNKILSIFGKGILEDLA